MEFLGVGPLELLFIFLIALIVLGPKDMAKTGRTLGRFMYKIVTSPTWQTFRQASRDLRQLPTKLMREAGLEEEELKKLSEEIGLKDNFGVSRQDLSLSSWTTTPTDNPPSPSPSVEETEEPMEGNDIQIAGPDMADENINATNDESPHENPEAISPISEQTQMIEDQVLTPNKPLGEQSSELDQTQEKETS